MGTLASLLDRADEARRLPWLVLAGGALLVFFVGVGERQVQGTAAFYAALSRQIVETGVWHPLHTGPEPYFMKPPLLFWLTAATIGLLGPTNLAVTLWPRLFGVGCVLLGAGIGRRLYGPTAGLLAGLVCLANPTLIETSNTFRLDSALLFGVLLAVWAYLAPAGRWRPPVFYGAMAFAMLAKGPQGLLPLVFAGVHAASSGRLVGARRPAARPWLLWALLLALPLLWGADLQLRFAEFLPQFVADANMREVGGPLDHLWRAVYHNFWSPLVRWLPFSPLMVWGLVRTLRGAGGPQHRADDRALLVWVLGMLTLLSIRESYRMRYVLLVLPPLAWLGGRELARLLGERIPLAASRVAAVVLVLAALGVAAFRPGFERGDGMAGVAAMRRAFDAELPSASAPVPLLLPEGREMLEFGGQWSPRDWTYFYLHRPLRVVHPDELPEPGGGRLYFVYEDDIAQMRRDLPIRVLVETGRAYLVELVPGKVDSDRISPRG